MQLLLALGVLLGGGAPTLRAETAAPPAAVQVLRAARQLEARPRRFTEPAAAGMPEVPTACASPAEPRARHGAPRARPKLYLERRVLLI